jgi:hypothetical protein
MCNDKASNVVIYSSNANIHVYVHEDLNEIYLLNVKGTISPDYKCLEVISIKSKSP